VTSLAQPSPRATRARKPVLLPPLLRHGGAAALTLFAFAGLWWAAAPPALRGTTTLATVDGTSMLPRYKRSDLIALRRHPRYHVGEVVGYQSTMLHRIVLHRIVAIHNGHYTFKGDNNNFTDPEAPMIRDLVGAQALHLAGAGEAIAWLHKPWFLASLTAVLVLSLGIDIRPHTTRDDRR
jgi:signal peptidase I